MEVAQDVDSTEERSLITKNFDLDDEDVGAADIGYRKQR